MESYRKLPELAEIVLEESYQAPLPGEQFCHPRGTLVITGVTRSLWAGQGSAPARDADDELDLGHIDALGWDTEHVVLEGDWGHLELAATSIRVALR